MKPYIILSNIMTGPYAWFDDRIVCTCAKSSNGETFSMSHQVEALVLDSFIHWFGNIPEDFVVVTKGGKFFGIPFLLSRIATRRELKAMDFKILYHKQLDFDEIVNADIGIRELAKLFACKTKAPPAENLTKFQQEGKLQDIMEHCMQLTNLGEEIYLAYLSMQMAKNKELRKLYVGGKKWQEQL